MKIDSEYWDSNKFYLAMEQFSAVMQRKPRAVTSQKRLLKGAVSSFTHMLLRIINLKALGQRFQVRNPRWRLQRRASMV